MAETHIAARATTGPSPMVVDDGGFSLLEILITLALMGTAIVSVLVGLRATINSSTIDRDHATAFAWLQAASDEIYRGPRVPCTSGQAAAIASYDARAKSAPVPPVWASQATTIEVIDVEYLGKTTPDDEFEWSDTFCFEGAAFAASPLYTQRVTLRVIGPHGRLVRTMQMVKSE